MFKEDNVIHLIRAYFPGLPEAEVAEKANAILQVLEIDLFNLVREGYNEKERYFEKEKN